MGHCLSPYNVKDGNKNNIPVPCGKCPPCLKRRASGWSFRLMQQEKIAESAYFITLTYDTKNVPITERGFMSLDKRDVQLFFKRLRKAHNSDISRRIKYFAVGEYGGKTLRPHYHIILFNAELNKIDPAWNLGNVHYGAVSGASVGYCLKYMMKPGKVPLHANDDRSKEFQLTSKGLGSNYLTPQMVEWHKKDLENRVHMVIEGGKKIAMPRYYREKIYNSEEKGHLKGYWEIKNLELTDQHAQEMFERYGENWAFIEAEDIKAQFEKFKRDAVKDRNKI